jgi:hypothetical protein
MKAPNMRSNPRIQARLRGIRRDLDAIYSEIDEMPSGTVGKHYCALGISDAIDALDKVILATPTESH